MKNSVKYGNKLNVIGPTIRKYREKCHLSQAEVSAKLLLLGIDIPKNSLVVSIVRDDELIIPQGDTVFSAGDEVIVICSGEGSSKKISKLF